MKTNDMVGTKSNWKYYVEDYWDIVVGIVAIVTAIFLCILLEAVHSPDFKFFGTYCAII